MYVPILTNNHQRRDTMQSMDQIADRCLLAYETGHGRQIHLRRKIQRRELRPQARSAISAFNGEFGTQYVR